MRVQDRAPATNVERIAEGNSHDYFRRSPWVSSDVLLVLRFGLKPSERGLVRSSGDPVWQFPEDYPQHVRAIAEHLCAGQAHP